jgi:hypothetical protein
VEELNRQLFIDVIRSPGSSFVVAESWNEIHDEDFARRDEVRHDDEQSAPSEVFERHLQID